MYIIYVQLKYTTEEWLARKHDKKWGYVRNRSQLTRNIATARIFETENEAMDFDFRYYDEDLISSIAVDEYPRWAKEQSGSDKMS